VHLPGRRQLVKGLERASVHLTTTGHGATLSLYEHQEDGCETDTIHTMEAVLKKNVCEQQTAQRRPPVAETIKPYQPPPALQLSLRQCMKFSELFLRDLSSEQLKETLERHAVTKTSQQVIDEEVCNDGESFLTTTLYQTRVFKQEWILLKRSFLETL
jgi:hypothetical protein